MNDSNTTCMWNPVEKDFYTPGPFAVVYIDVAIHVSVAVQGNICTLFSLPSLFQG